MIYTTNVTTFNLKNAMRGMRNPHNGAHLSDSTNEKIGPKDLTLATKLAHAGSDHRKFMRQIIVSMDIVAPLYWWKEYDTYKVGTVTNSTSTMHTLHKNEINIDMFSHENMSDIDFGILNSVIKHLETLRLQFIKSNNKSVWETAIRLLPSCFNQTRACLLNYEVLYNIYHARKGHKLKEWNDFCDQIKTLPFANELIIQKNKNETTKFLQKEEKIKYTEKFENAMSNVVGAIESFINNLCEHDDCTKKEYEQILRILKQKEKEVYNGTHI